jgi:hypothetical protein
VQAQHAAVPDKRLPAIDVAIMRLTRHAAEPLEVTLDDWAPLLHGSCLPLRDDRIFGSSLKTSFQV